MLFHVRQMIGNASTQLAVLRNGGSNPAEKEVRN